MCSTQFIYVILLIYNIEKFLPSCFFVQIPISDLPTSGLCLTGLICAEGELWRDQRRFVTTCLKNFGMIKYGAKRDKMESRISVGVQESIEVKLLFDFFVGLLINE